MVVLVAWAFMGVTAAKPSDQLNEGMSAFERWTNLRSQISALEDSSTAFANDPSWLSYKDGPYPEVQDNGALKDAPRDVYDIPQGWGEYCVSDVICMNVFAGRPTEVTNGGGDFLVGHTHESIIGDQNGNGIMESVVFYFYIPWMKDGIDNDGDGCIDEKVWWPCDLIPDAMVIYETGIMPRLGGEDGTLLVNLDWYSDVDTIKIYRTFVSPKWGAYRVRGLTYYPQIAGEFISYRAREMVNGVNANPEMDNDLRDEYVGNIDARGFPGRPPVNHACSAGTQPYSGSTFQRDDGWVVTSFSLVESFDNHDWNGDGDKMDYIAAYYALDPVTGNCRNNAVNTAVSGYLPTTSGALITPMYTSEYRDRRDWDGNGIISGYKKLYHTVDSTWSLKGRIYTSVTFTAHVPRWGFGWWAMYDTTTYRTYPLKFGVGFQQYVAPSQGYYHTMIVLTADEDGNRHTVLPRYDVAYGYPEQALDGECLWITSHEFYLRTANIWLYPGHYAGDANGDGRIFGYAILFFCPNEVGGGGHFIVEPTSKFAQGMYITPIPFVVGGIMYHFDAGGVIDGRVTIPVHLYEWIIDDDCNWNGRIESTYCPTYYQFHL